MAVKYSGLLKFTDEIKAEIDLAADGAVEKAVIIDGDGVETPISGGSPTTFTLHIVKGDGVSNIDFDGCIGTEDGSKGGRSRIEETSDIIVLPYNGKAPIFVGGKASTQGYVVSADIDGDIEALPTAHEYLMTGNATIVLTAETPQS